MNLSQYLMSQRDVNDRDVQNDRSFPVAKRITYRDGFSLSVQATHGAYCSPRKNIGPWDQVEVGFPSAKPELIMHRAALRFYRSADEAFRTPTYAQGWEPHIPPPLWHRIVLFFKRNFA